MKNTNVGSRLTSRRQELGLTVSELARTVNIHHTSILKIEQGGSKRPRHVFEIADALHVNVDWLARGKGAKL